ncbi:type II CAAX prenyl endopeptidase Rce1 family protein [Ruminococcus sp.]|uniref:CPBP family glutamic-type intramembrane protease n=1 Tax=Ruminococcus sp. TaxID=41978 RepID=UPI0038905CB6
MTSDTRAVHKNLKWWDILLLTLMIMGYPVIRSVSGFLLRFCRLGDDSYLHDLFGDNRVAVVSTSCLFGLALLYLYLRRYDFSGVKLFLAPEVLFVSIFLFLAAALMTDVYLLVCHTAGGFFHLSALLGRFEGLLAAKPLPAFEMLSFIYAIVCGFTEEIFYLGFCLSVSENKMIPAFIYTQLIRFFSHTDQGVCFALGIALIWGTVFYCFYRFYPKASKRNLLPFCIAHVISSMLGHGILSYLTVL